MMEKQGVYQAKLHWIIFFWPLMLLVLALFFYANLSEARMVALVFFLAAIAWGLIAMALYLFSSLTIKNTQVIFRTGLVVRRTIDIPMNKIESISIKQSILGSIFRYGTIVITGTGGTWHGVSNITNPLTCRRYIEQFMHDV